MIFTWHLVVEPFGVRTSSLAIEPELEILVQVICGRMLPEKTVEEAGQSMERLTQRPGLSWSQLHPDPQGAQEPICTTEPLLLGRRPTFVPYLLVIG